MFEPKQYALLETNPRSARESMFGVMIASLPRAWIVSDRWCKRRLKSAADIEKIRRNNSVERIAKLSEYTLSGDIRLGLGDDWPLWVPEKRRKKNGRFLADRDEAGLSRELQYAFGGIEGLPKTHISILYVLQTEIEACHPDNPDGQNKWLYEVLSAARDRLKQEDPINPAP